MKIIILSVLVIAMIGMMIPNAFGMVDNGDFNLVYYPTENFSEYYDDQASPNWMMGGLILMGLTVIVLLLVILLRP